MKRRSFIATAALFMVAVLVCAVIIALGIMKYQNYRMQKILDRKYEIQWRQQQNDGSGIQLAVSRKRGELLV